MIDKKSSARNGEIYPFDTNRKACAKYGFFAGSRVTTPRGKGTGKNWTLRSSQEIVRIVIGVNSNNLWIHVDGDRGKTQILEHNLILGASFWDNNQSYEAFIHAGFSLIDDDVKFLFSVISIHFISGFFWKFGCRVVVISSSEIQMFNTFLGITNLKESLLGERRLI
jgi:hypothetical protein